MDWGDCAPNGIATFSCIPIVFQNIVNFALSFAGALAVLMIIYSGIKYITSSGDPKAVESAKNTLRWALIGLVVIVFSFIMINIIANVTGASCITTFGFTNC